MFLSYRNQFTDLLCKSMGQFLNDRDLRHVRVKTLLIYWKSGSGEISKHKMCQWNFISLLQIWKLSSENIIKTQNKAFHHN